MYVNSTVLRERLLADDHAALINYTALGADAEFAISSPEHYLPLLYILGLQQDGEKVLFPMVMRAVPFPCSQLKSAALYDSTVFWLNDERPLGKVE